MRTEKRILSLLLACAVLLCLPGCGKKKKTETAAPQQAAPEKLPDYVQVSLNMDNFFDYFQYKEFRSAAKDDNGKTTSMQILYGFELKEGYTAANTPEHKDTLKVEFSANAIVKNGSFQINYETLDYTGNVASTDVVPVTKELVFWAQGNRTEIYAYGVYNNSYVIYLQDFRVLSVTGSIWIVNPALAALNTIGGVGPDVMQ